ncbi:MAG TPA: nickel pincer cofactor biosynthesis protein LarC [Polyangiaceae bacterium]|nr:nickel pincer cofactor biosynthesis protein LarC [Polyangiaceae bacterium]
MTAAGPPHHHYDRHHLHAHGDEHDHEHPHAHEHTSGHEHAVFERVALLAGDAEAHRAPLARGEGRGKLLFLDPWSGIAGDMTVAALVDLGVPFAVVQASLAGLGVAGVAAVSRARSGALGATHFSVSETAPQPHRPYGEVRRLLANAPLETGVRALAERIFARLAAAEAAVHRVPLEDVTFHEVGSVDSLFDVVGAATCFEYLGARVLSAPVPLGRGHVHTAHGELPIPAPATLECLRGVPTLDAGVDFENVTPTGAAILATVAEGFLRWPSQRASRIGWGAGTRVVGGRANALRVVLGEPVGADHDASAFVVLEANVDDMTGELAGHAIAAVMAAGALDAWATPITMKKGRPGLVLSALVRAEAADALAGALLRETTSLGVRFAPVSRLERPRRTVEVTTRFGVIPLKVSEGPYGAPQAKPEFAACERAAELAGVSVREVLAEALAAYASASR